MHLGGQDIVAFVNVRNANHAERFYSDVLGLKLLEREMPYALVYDANGILLRLAINPEHMPLPGTVLGWRVADVRMAVQLLGEKGVRFEKFPWLEQDELGVWLAPKGRVAWFKDPDGNMLSLSQHD